jgi:hypothetical protein
MVTLVIVSSQADLPMQSRTLFIAANEDLRGCRQVSRVFPRADRGGCTTSVHQFR